MIYVIIKETKNTTFYRHILILTDSRSEKNICPFLNSYF